MTWSVQKTQGNVKRETTTKVGWPRWPEEINRVTVHKGHEYPET